MKSKFLFLLAIAAGSLNVSAQNLVPNGSFEEVVNCPEFLASLHTDCADWYASVVIPGGSFTPSPDWYHPCSPQALLVPPETINGFVEPTDGGALAGILNSWDNNENIKEMIGVQLNNSLVSGSTYVLRFDLYHTNAQNHEYSSNNIGVRFTTYAGYESLEAALTNEAHLNIDSVLAWKDVWQTFEFEFTADSAYEYMHIGNFFDDDNTIVLRPPGITSIGSYYFIDNVSLEEGTLSAAAEIDNKIDFDFYPNPTVGEICISKNDMHLEIKEAAVIDRMGRTINRSVKLNQGCFDLAPYESGIYFLRIKTKNYYVTKKIVKI